MNKFCQLFKYKKLFPHKSIKVGYNFTSNEKQEESIKFVKLDNLKGFGKKFSDEEMKKYLDPFGFLTPNEYQEKKIKEIDKEHSVIPKNEKSEIVQKLEDIEKIKDPAKKADEKCKNMPKEYGYKYNGPEPTRYGDWDTRGKCSDF